MSTPKTIEEYIAQQPEKVRPILRKTRETITNAAPKAEERIHYRMPCFWLNGPLIYFAGMKNHLGIYPTANGIEAFKDRLSEYKFSKGAIQFPYNKEIDYDLIAEITRWRVTNS